MVTLADKSKHNYHALTKTDLFEYKKHPYKTYF